MNVQMINVDSSNIYSVGYDENNCILYVDFRSGSRYEYFSVPKAEFIELLNASSKGRYFNSNIRNKYEYKHLL